jgi:alanine racemase
LRLFRCHILSLNAKPQSDRSKKYISHLKNLKPPSAAEGLPQAQQTSNLKQHRYALYSHCLNSNALFWLMMMEWLVLMVRSTWSFTFS